MSNLLLLHLLPFPFPLVEDCSHNRRYGRSEEVWASIYAAQFSGNTAGCGCNHHYSIYNRYGRKQALKQQQCHSVYILISPLSLPLRNPEIK